MFWVIVIGLGIAWIMQSILSLRQMKMFSTEFVEMRRVGKVCLGKYQGGIVQGAIVMFLLDEDGRVVRGRRMHGVSVLAGLRSFELYDGEPMSEVDPIRAMHWGRALARAVENARLNYELVTSGQEAPEPPTALSRSITLVSGRWRRKPADLPI